MFKGFFFKLLFILILFFQPAFILAKEEIINFSANINLLSDGSVDVIEKITVRAEGIKIKRGIYRDIPTIMINNDGSQYSSKLEIISVKKNGVKEPYFTTKIKNGIRLYIGQSSVFLPKGQYEYEIYYNMTRQVRFFADHDELFWNVTGNFWDFPINKTIAKINLPDGAKISDIIAYSGAFGSKEQNVTINKLSDNNVIFIANRSFAPFEGMTVAVKFQKGVISEPNIDEKIILYFLDRKNIFLPPFLAILVFIYYLYSWLRVGRDPQRGVIIPLFYPPKNFSPALVHYVWKMGWKKAGWTAFVAALVNLAVKGLIRIEKEKNKTIIYATAKRVNSLPTGEQIIYDFIKAKIKLPIDKSNGERINKIRQQFTKQIGIENRQIYFRDNFFYLIFGYILSIICLFILVFFGILHLSIAFGAIFIGIVLGLSFAGFINIWMGSRIRSFFLIIWFSLFGFNFFSSFLLFLTEISALNAIIAVISIIMINIIFTILMRAPTILGQQKRDEIAGFKLYLETAEKTRLNAQNMQTEPELSIKRFEEILPYAIALGVEKIWSDYFVSKLAKNAIPNIDKNYRPDWYRGVDFSPSNFSKNINSISKALSASMIAAQSVSSSSSAFSSSGGFSGGGGGGGGGGGW